MGAANRVGAVAGAGAGAWCTDDLGGHRRAWDDLVARSPLASPFLRSWWLEAVVVDEPAYVLVLDGDELLGGLALEHRRRHGVPWFRHIGDLLGDHLDVVARPGCETDVVEALWTWWQRPGNRVLEVRHGAPVDGLLARRWERAGEVEPGMVAPFASLPPTSSEYLRRLPGEVRSTIKRAGARLEREGVHHRVVDDPAHVDGALADLHSLHGARWSSDSAFLPEFARFTAAARAGVAAGELVFHQLVHEDVVIATEVELEVAGRTSFFQAGRLDERRWRGSGTVLKAKTIERACQRGDREYDLLRGADAYKDLWADGSRQLATIRAAHGTAARAALGLERARRRGRAVGRRLSAARRGGGGA